MSVTHLGNDWITRLTKTKGKQNWSKQVCWNLDDRLVSGRGVIEDTTYLMNIGDKILLPLKFELTQEYSASKSQHCCHFLLLGRGVAMQQRHHLLRSRKGVQAETTIFFVVWLVLFEYSSFDHFPNKYYKYLRHHSPALHSLWTNQYHE